MLQRLATLVNEQLDFALETTLATRSYVSFLRDCKNQGYQINLIYFG